MSWFNHQGSVGIAHSSSVIYLTLDQPSQMFLSSYPDISCPTSVEAFIHTLSGARRMHTCIRSAQGTAAHYFLMLQRRRPRGYTTEWADRIGDLPSRKQKMLYHLIISSYMYTKECTDLEVMFSTK